MYLDFDEIYTKYYNKITSYLALLLGSSREAEDIAQETFIKMMKSPPRDDNILGWLFTVSKNLAINHLKSQRSRNEREKRYFQDYELPKSDNIAEIILIRNTLEKMPEEQRTILILKYSGYTYGEIARILHINPSSVGQLIARAQRKFKKIFEGEEGE